jgi:hypothetical protein
VERKVSRVNATPRPRRSARAFTAVSGYMAHSCASSTCRTR